MSNPVQPLNAAQTKAAEARSAKHSYPVRVLIAIDQLGAALFGAPLDTTIPATPESLRWTAKGWHGAMAARCRRF
jgi:hypothetical protein